MNTQSIKYLLFSFNLVFSQFLIAEPLEEIIVKGDWRSVEASEKASSLLIFENDLIEKKQFKHFEDLSYAVPNLNFAASDSRPRYFQIRGIGERSGYEGTPNSSVGFLIDDIDFSGQGGIASTFDLEQIEVYRGPQGSRMGANSLAGMIYVKTSDPEDFYVTKIDVTLGDYGRKDIGAVINIPVNESFKYRISLKKEDFDGFRKNLYLNRSDTSRKDEETIRFKTQWDIKDNSSLNLVYFNHDFDDPADIWTIDGSLNTLSDRPGMDSQDSEALGLRFEHQLSSGEFQLLYSKTDTDIVFSYDADWGNANSHNPYIYDYFSETLRKRETNNFELRLISDDFQRNDKWNWIVGFSSFEIDENNDKFDDGAYGDPFDGYDTFYSKSFFSSTYSSESDSVFGNIEYLLTEKARLSLGIRWEDWDANYFDSNNELFNPSNKMNGGKLSFTNQLDEETSFYLSIAKGYKQGGFNLGTGLNESTFSESIKYDPETLVNYEFGLDRFFPLSKTNFDLVLFYSDRRDQQVLISTQVDPQDPNTFLYLTRNAAEGENYGAEFSLSTQFSDKLDVFADIGLLKTKIKNYSSRPDLEGRGQAHAPSFSFSAGLNLEISNNLELLLDINGKNDFYYSDSHDNKSDSYVLTNLNFLYKHNGFTYNFWVRNLFDEYYSLRGFYFGNEPPNFEDKLYERHGDPRNLGLSILYDF